MLYQNAAERTLQYIIFYWNGIFKFNLLVLRLQFKYFNTIIKLLNDTQIKSLSNLMFHIRCLTEQNTTKNISDRMIIIHLKLILKSHPHNTQHNMKHVASCYVLCSNRTVKHTACNILWSACFASLPRKFDTIRHLELLASATFIIINYYSRITSHRWQKTDIFHIKIRRLALKSKEIMGQYKHFVRMRREDFESQKVTFEMFCIIICIFVFQSKEIFLDT